MVYTGGKKNCMQIEAALAKGPRTCAELAEDLGLGVSTIWRWLQLLTEGNAAYVDRKIVSENGGPLVAVYRAGPRPANHKVREAKPLGDLGRTHKYRKKLRASGDWEDRLAKQRAKYWVDRTIKRDPLVAAFFGPMK